MSPVGKPRYGQAPWANPVGRLSAEGIPWDTSTLTAGESSLSVQSLACRLLSRRTVVAALGFLSFPILTTSASPTLPPTLMCTLVR